MSALKEIYHIVETLKADGANDSVSMLNALKDGEVLAKHQWPQEQVEYVYDLVRTADDDELKYLLA